jgi:hypothetical protein
LPAFGGAAGLDGDDVGAGRTHPDRGLQASDDVGVDLSRSYVILT